MGWSPSSLWWPQTASGSEELGIIIILYVLILKVGRKPKSQESSKNLRKSLDGIVLSLLTRNWSKWTWHRKGYPNITVETQKSLFNILLNYLLFNVWFRNQVSSRFYGRMEAWAALSPTPLSGLVFTFVLVLAFRSVKYTFNLQLIAFTLRIVLVSGLNYVCLHVLL